MCNFMGQIFFLFLGLSFISYSSRSTVGYAFVGDYCMAQMLKVTPFSLVPPNSPAAERSPWQQRAACQVALLTQSTWCFHHQISPGKSSAAPTHCARSQHPSSRRSQRCLPIIYLALLLRSSPSFCRELGFETGRLQCRNTSC